MLCSVLNIPQCPTQCQELTLHFFTCNRFISNQPSERNLLSYSQGSSGSSNIKFQIFQKHFQNVSLLCLCKQLGCKFYKNCFDLCVTVYTFFICNQGQSSALKVASIFKVFGAQSCLMVAQYFDQATYVCKEYNNFKYSKSIFIISDFKIFPIKLLRQLNFGALSVQQLFYKEKAPLFFNLQFLLSLNERRLSPESCLEICHPRANSL